MKISRLVCYLLIPTVGLLLAYGCSSPTSGGGGGGGNGTSSYTLEVSVSPTTVTADSGLGQVSCFLTYGSQPVVDQQVWFSTYSQQVSNANITVAGFTSATSETGLSTNVNYRPNDYEGEQDTIFAVYKVGEDTVASDYTTVTIHHPEIGLAISLDPQSVYPDSNAEVNCYLTADDVVVSDKMIYFWTVPAATPSAVAPSNSLTSATSPSGLYFNVRYFPNGYTGPVDTVYACFIDDEDTVATAYTVAQITQP